MRVAKRSSAAIAAFVVAILAALVFGAWVLRAMFADTAAAHADEEELQRYCAALSEGSAWSAEAARSMGFGVQPSTEPRAFDITRGGAFNRCAVKVTEAGTLAQVQYFPD